MLHTTHYSLHTTHYTLNTTHYILKTAHCTLQVYTRLLTERSHDGPEFLGGDGPVTVLGARKSGTRGWRRLEAGGD